MKALQPILYAEDDDNDVFLMERALKKLGVKHPLKSVGDGRQAIAYLSSAPPFADTEAHPLPLLMLLDLSMPGIKGLDVLKWVRTQPKLAGLPVVVLTSSNQETDIHRAYLLGASGFFIKPGDPNELLRIVSAIEQHWLSGTPSESSFLDVAAYRAPAQGPVE